MFCIQCGAQNAATAKFCAECGTAVAAVATSARVDPTLARDASPPASSAPSTAARASEPSFSSRQPAVTDEPAPSSDELFSLAIGDRGRDFYLPRFETFAAGGGSATWNWAAFFFTFYWLLYRKLWGTAVFYAVGSYFVTIAFAVVAGMAPSAGIAVTIAALVLYFVVPGLWANRLYFARCTKLIERATRLSPDTRVQKAWLASKGGTSAVAAVAIGLFIGVGVIGMLAAIALPAYQDYTVRARVMGAHQYAGQISGSIAEKYSLSGRYPASLADVAMPDFKPAEVAGVQMDPSDGAIQIQVAKLPAGKDTFEIVPSLDPQKRLVWTCQSVNIEEKHLPQLCRQAK